ncbi:FadR family transcriptional regulator [Leucobacter coleopterorum]|uniref:FadR family transcriptional regulator n=1 Tax=Leucobacter coleopterorum TaxID=2714933 RepID=A0ABX6K307_9MICO|nr:FadR/GntR family transcriptional regulator [Leucobacter coleopterorum]QIM19529.1 FadR family transcriptional regulator [Leucobacter coleopterorum]
MRQVVRRSLVDVVVDELKREIAEGTWSIGDRLPSEAELTSILGVSRASVREGVRSLVQLGLLETRQGDGTYLVATDPTQVALRRALQTADVREVIEVRRALDIVAARGAAANHTEQDLESLSEQLRLRKEAVAAHDAEAFADADVAFHLGVAAASGNRLLSDIYASFDTTLRESIIDASVLAEGKDPDPKKEHERLYAAIVSGDPTAAQAAALGVLDQQARLVDARG